MQCKCRKKALWGRKEGTTHSAWGEGEGGVGGIQGRDGKLFLSMTKTTRWTSAGYEVWQRWRKGLLGGGKICMHA